MKTGCLITKCALRLAVGLACYCLPGHGFGAAQVRVLHSFGTTTDDGLIGVGTAERMAGRVVLGPDGWLYGSTKYGGHDNAGTLFKLKTDGSGYAVLHNFATNNTEDGAYPVGDIVVTQDGWLWGVTDQGGATGAGTVYGCSLDGSDFGVLHSFQLHVDSFGATTDHPANLTEGSDGALYGTIRGETGGFGGAVFRVGNDGGYSEMLFFDSLPFAPWDIDAAYPETGVVQGRDGALYGTWEYGGVFRVGTDGSGAAELLRFWSTDQYAIVPKVAETEPAATLIQGSDGALYGMTVLGGTNAQGTIFRLNTDGSGYTLLHSFVDPLRYTPVWSSSLAQGADGALYGTTMSGGYGGYAGQGIAFQINTDGSGYRELWRFTELNSLDAANPVSLIPGADGSFYGIGQTGGTMGYGAVFKLTPTNGFSSLGPFGINATDGATPQAPLVMDADGTLYGTTAAGGSGSGTIFRANPTSSGHSTLYQFSADGVNGMRPFGMILGADGALYGTAAGGTKQAGVLYKVNRDGTGYTLLHTFYLSSDDGLGPIAPPIQGPGGRLFGLTEFGGNLSAAPGPPGFGTVYQVDADGSNYAVLFRFSTNTLAGDYPTALLLGTDGVFYGAGMAGTNESGFIYRLSTDGNGYAVVYNFDASPPQGQLPTCLIQGSDGWLYGTTLYGGSSTAGTVFKLQTSGTGYVQLYAFSTNNFDGQWPQGIVQGRDGMLYGTTQLGGDQGLGTVFRVGTDGTGYSVLYSFTGAEGATPLAPPIQGADGALYGTLSSGGPNGVGSVFRLAVASSVAALALSSPTMLPDGSFAFSINGGVPKCRIDASTDLGNWVTLTNVVSAGGATQFTDPHASNFTRRFYRAVRGP